MQTPPVYTPPPAAPPRKNRTALWIAVAIGGMCLCCSPLIAAIVFPVFAQSRQAAQRTQCLNNVKQLATAQLIYAGDWDDRLPPASKWMDSLKSLPSRSVNPKAFQCPLVRDGHGYAMSDAMSKKRLAEIEKPERKILIFETDDLSYNAHGDPRSVKKVPRHRWQSVGMANGSVIGVPTPAGASATP